MSAVIVVATIKPKPGQEQEVLEALQSSIPLVHKEPGCEKYALHQGLGDSTDLVMIERWESAEALKEHGSATALAELGKALKGKLAGPPEVVRLASVPTGTAEQGAI
ncbi:MAG: antibiotic biosynthesis monooxygenase [Pseudonocardia sp.]|nr:antibiotic biosynthesis monooxygenase [Pseudonocardia sp.]